MPTRASGGKSGFLLVRSRRMGASLTASLRVSDARRAEEVPLACQADWVDAVNEPALALYSPDEATLHGRIASSPPGCTVFFLLPLMCCSPPSTSGGMAANGTGEVESSSAEPERRCSLASAASLSPLAPRRSTLLARPAARMATRASTSTSVSKESRRSIASSRARPAAAHSSSGCRSTGGAPAAIVGGIQTYRSLLL
eukprot:scaffold119356_cov30-Tisochrysis_lutea.AAC.1